MLEWMDWGNLARWVCTELVSLMMNDERNAIWWDLCPPRVRGMGKRQPSVSYTLCRKEVMKPEMILSPLSISESTATGVVSRISQSAMTQLLSTSSVSAMN